MKENLSSEERERLKATIELGDVEALYQEVEKQRATARAVGYTEGYERKVNKTRDPDLFSTALFVLSVTLSVLFLAGLVIKAQINNVNEGRREFHACASGWTAECMQAVYDEGGNSSRAKLYANVYHQVKGVELPPYDKYKLKDWCSP